jgi:pimeloyl-ACP methyl ester carboxylesterase
MSRAKNLVAWSTALVIVLSVQAPVHAVQPAAKAAAVCGAGGDVEDVALKTGDGLALAASLYLPSKAGRSPAVMMVHRPGGNRREQEDVARQLVRRGFAVLSMDLRGHGQSVTGDATFATLAPEEQARMWTFTLRDLEAGASFLRGRRDIHTTNLSVVGFADSCGLALRHASQDENVRAVVLVSPGENQLGFSLSEEIKRCGGMPTLILTPKDGRPLAQRLIDGLGGPVADTIRLEVLKADEYQADRRLPFDIANYLRDTVVERKGA